MDQEFENEIVIGKTRCLWVPTEDKGTVVRVWADNERNGQLWLDVVWDKDGAEIAYPGFDHELKMFSPDGFIIDIDKVKDAHETGDSTS